MVIDFWGENPFAELDLPFPPVPSGKEIGDKIRQKTTLLVTEMRRLQAYTDEGSKKRYEELEAENKNLKELKSKLIEKSRELADAISFDTLLAVQYIAPELFSRRSERSEVIAQTWRSLWSQDDDLTLSDTNRTGFGRDSVYNPLLDDEI